MFQYPETKYPATFRQLDVSHLRRHLQNKDSIVFVGMKRVGISNFLRFLLHQPTAHQQAFEKRDFVVFVDLNDLVECTPAAFWILLLKRLVDSMETTSFSQELQERSHKLFVESIQLKDAFCSMDSTQKILKSIVSQGRYPVIILTRFDRLLRIMTPEFFSNLQSLKDAAGELSYIFTSAHPLDQLLPEISHPSSFTLFAQNQYIRPLNENDSYAILASLTERYGLQLSEDVTSELITITGGHVQYLHLGLIACSSLEKDQRIPTNLLQHLSEEESIALQSEELYESLSETEQQFLREKYTEKGHTGADTPSYLIDTGFINTHGQLFSPLFTEWLQQRFHANKQLDLSRQEQRLFDLLLQFENEIVERYEIIEAVWPDQVELGVSDWSIDRLVARLRAKMKLRQDSYKIVTVVTRGYKMTKTL